MQSRFASNSAVWASMAEDSMVFVVIDCVLSNSGKCGGGMGFFRGRAFFSSLRRCTLPRTIGGGDNDGTWSRIAQTVG